MSKRDRYPAGVPCWVDTLQPDPQATTRFYGALFGWEFIGPGPMPGDPPGQYFVARVGGRDVAGIGSMPQQGGPPVPVWSTHIRVQSADQAAAAAERAGGQILTPPFDVLPAGRMAVLADPAGAVFCVWEARDRQGAQLINEPWAWSMSLLSTNDTERAAAFYSEMFGWETQLFGSVGAQITLFRLPGYVGGEAEQPVSRDVVAVMTSAAPSDPFAHWSVDFWVGDADAAAAETATLGGKVIVQPYDIPSFRSAVLADPQGAVFSVSKLSVGPRHMV